MRFEQGRASAAGILALAFLIGAGGCGVLGAKNEDAARRTLVYPLADEGCLNRVGPELDDYLAGNLSAETWARRWDCTIDALVTFNSLGGRGNPGFTQDEIRNLVAAVLVTNKPVSSELIAAAFELKASVLGGSTALATPAEISFLIELLGTIKAQTLRLLPLLAQRRGSPTIADMRSLADASAPALLVIGEKFGHRDAPPLSRRTVETLLRHLGALLEWNVPNHATDLLFAVKTVLLGGSATALEPGLWPRLWAGLGTAGGALIALTSVDRERVTEPNGYGLFAYEMASRIRGLLESAISDHGGAIPMPELVRLVRSLNAAGWPISKDAIEKTLPVLTTRIFAGTHGDGLDSASLGAAFALFDRWTMGQTHLERIFDEYSLDPDGTTADEFIQAARHYSSQTGRTGTRDLDAVSLLIRNTQVFRPLFRQGDPLIWFDREKSFSLNNQSRFVWMRIIAETAVHAYSSAPAGDRIGEADFRNLIEDFKLVGIDLGAVDPTVPQFDRRRLREADLHVYASNGDGTVDADEATYYIAFLASIARLSHAVRGDIEAPCAIGENRDALGWRWMDAGCFRREYFARTAAYWSHAPGLLEFYHSLSDEGQRRLRQAIEQGARLHGFSESPIGGYDAKAFVAVMHFVESYFERNDADGDSRLSTGEVLGAAPLYRNAIAEIAGVSPANTALIDSIYAYSVNKGEPPAKSVLGSIELVGWMAIRPFWNINAGRSEIYQTIPLVNTFE